MNRYSSLVMISTVAGLALAVLALGAPLPAKPAAKTPVKAVTAPANAPIIALTASPASIALNGPYSEVRLLLDGRTRTGVLLDAGPAADIRLLDPKVASVDENGIVRGVKDGSTTLVASVQGNEARVPVTVRGCSKPAPPRFLSDVMPVLTRGSCNTGACHGSASGKGGLKFSLFGFDPEPDYLVITRAAAGRRVARTRPEASLLLRKPTLGVAHKGGQRFRTDSPEYRLLRDWIAAGCPGPDAKEPKVVKLQVTPAARTLEPGLTQRFVVKATYSDGATRDVSGEAVFTASDESVATVTPSGEAKVIGRGDGAVLVRYQSLVATAHVISPFGTPKAVSKWRAPGASTTAWIDKLVQDKLDVLGLPVSPRCSDTDFLRRATLDVTGLLPTPEEVRAFTADRDPKKREKLIDSLFERSEYIDFWTLKWGDLLRSTRKTLSEKGMASLNYWIRQSVAENKPWDKFARELILAQGGAYTNGPANFFRTAAGPQELAETTSQIFLGVRIQCAKCHNHPYDKWTQNQYYEMASFFARVKKKADGGAEPLVLTVRNGEVTNPRTNKQAVPCALDAAPVPASYTGDRRVALADWLTSPKNPFFSKIIVNRVWRHYMGRGLVEAVDDLRLTNPPSNEPLFEFLAKDFAAKGFDLRALMRSIMLSDAYQRSAVPIPGNVRDGKFYSHYSFKRLGAEQLMDALSTATGVGEKFAGFPVGMHASQLPDTTVPSYFLELFGRPARNITCECERTDEPNLGQILHLMNNKGLNERIAGKNGRVAKLIEAKATDAKLVEEIYLASVSRFPTADESKKAIAVLTKSKSRQQAAEDLLWALLNTKEFVFNH